MFSPDGEDTIQHLFMRASHAYFQKSFQQLASIGLRPGQPPILWHIAHENGVSQRDLAKKLRVKPPTVNVSLQRLEKAEYIYRKQDTKDQRVSRIYLTEKGTQLVNQVGRLMQRNEMQLTCNFSETELCLFTRFFKQLIENIESIGE